MSTLEQQIQAALEAKEAAPLVSGPQLDALNEYAKDLPDPLRGLVLSMGFLTGEPEEERLNELGTDVRGAPGIARLISSLPPDANDQLIALQRELKEFHGQPVQMRWGKEENALVYDLLDPEGKVEKTRIVDEPGLTFRDLADIGGESITATGEGLALGASAAIRGKGPKIHGKVKQVGRWLRHLAAGAAGAYGGETTRLGGAEAAGAYEHLSPEELSNEYVSEPSKAAGLSTLGTAGGAGAGMFAKAIANLVSRRLLPLEYIQKATQIKGRVEPFIEEVNQYLRIHNRTERLSPTTGELLNDPSILARERRLLEQPHLGGREAMTEKKVEQAGALNTAMTEAKRDVVGTERPPSALEAGRSVTEPLDTRYGEIEDAARSRVLDAEEGLGTAQAVMRGKQGLRPQEMGTTLRGVGEREQKKFWKWADQEYQQLDKLASGLEGKAVPLRKEVATQWATLEQDLAKNLTQENRATVQALMDTFANLDEAGKGVTMKQLNRLVSQLRAVERAVDDGLLGTVDTKAIKALKWAAVESRRDMTDTVPDLTAALAHVEKEYAKRKTQLNETILGSVMKKKKGIWNVADENVFSKVFHPNGVTDASVFAGALHGAEHVAAKDAFQRAIYRKYLDEVAPDGQMSAKAHDKFMRDYKDVLKVYFDGDISDFNNASTAFRALSDAVDHEKTLLKALKNQFGYQLRSWDPATLADKVWNNPGHAEAVRGIIENEIGEPQIWKGVQSYLLNRMEKAFFTQRLPGSAERTVSFRSLDNFLHDKSGKNRDRVATLFGPEYLNALEIVRDGALAVQRGIEYGNPPGSGNVIAEFWGNILGKAIQLKAGPLSKISRYSTRAMGFRTDEEARSLARVLVEPQMLVDMVDKAFTKSPTRWAQMMMGNLAILVATSEEHGAALKPGPAEALKESISEGTRGKIRALP